MRTCGRVQRRFYGTVHHASICFEDDPVYVQVVDPLRWTVLVAVVQEGAGLGGAVRIATIGAHPAAVTRKTRRSRVLPAFAFERAKEGDDVVDLAGSQAQTGAGDLERQIRIRYRATVVELHYLP
jgi:hypothetical protein